MPTHTEVRRIALSLPGTLEEEGNFRFGVRDPAKPKFSFHTQSFVWALYDRPHPRKPRVIRTDVIAVRVADLEEKQVLLLANDITFFREPHYDGHPVIGVYLNEVDVDELTDILIDAWQCVASK